MDILSKLPFLKQDEADIETSEVDEAQAKKDRAQFHRDRVRNGPTNFGFLTNGQVKRIRQRDLARSTRKARRAQVRSYLETQRLAATVRGHLQLAGVLPLATVAPTDIDRVNQIVSTGWIVQRFGRQIKGTDRVSFEYDDVLIALGEALEWWGEAVGVPNLQIPADYVVPIYQIDADGSPVESAEAPA